MTTAILNALFTGFAILFNIKAPVENGPVMDGHIKADDAAEEDKGIRIALFPKQGKESGKDYFSISVGSKENRVYGALFANDKKTADGQPDYTGSIELSKTEKLFLAGWNKVGEQGTFISLKIQPPMAKPEDAPAEAPADAELATA